MTRTTLSFLPADFYSKLESAVVNSIKLPRAKDPNQVSKLCYQTRSDKVDGAVITAHFIGANVLLYSSNTFVRVADDVVCFAFVPSQTRAVFGNLVQQNIFVGYDLQKNTMSFKLVGCTKL